MKKIAIVLFAVSAALAACGHKKPPATSGGGGGSGTDTGSATAPAGSGDTGSGSAAGGM